MALGNRRTPERMSPLLSGLPIPSFTVTTLVAGNQTITAAQILGGFVIFPAGGAETLTLPTAALAVAAIPGAAVGSGFEFTVRNTAGGANTATIAAGTGGTVSGTATIAQNNSKRFLLVFTNVTLGSEAYTVYSLGTVTT
jgi:hypothetical protein